MGLITGFHFSRELKCLQSASRGPCRSETSQWCWYYQSDSGLIVCWCGVMLWTFTWICTTCVLIVSVFGVIFNYSVLLFVPESLIIFALLDCHCMWLTLRISWMGWGYEEGRCAIQHTYTFIFLFGLYWTGRIKCERGRERGWHASNGRMLESNPWSLQQEHCLCTWDAPSTHYTFIFHIFLTLMINKQETRQVRILKHS